MTDTLTVIVDARPSDADAYDTVRAIQAAVGGAEVLVATDAEWPGAPEGVETVVFPSSGRGDRFDAAARQARGSLLAFVDGRAVVPGGWAGKVLEVFTDPDVVVAGGPVVPHGRSRSERVSALVMAEYLRASPASHNTRLGSSRRVDEVGAKNLVIRADAFRRVGGFQSPPGANAEAIRLCHKVRTILDGTIRSEPSLALHATAPRFARSLLRDIPTYGRSRGGLARRLPKTAPLMPYAAPSALFLMCIVGVVLLAVPGTTLEGVAVLAATFIPILYKVIRSMPTGPTAPSALDRLLAVLVSPLVVFVYGATFLSGFLGPNPEEMAPPRERTAPLRVLILNWRDVTHPYSGGAETYMHQVARRWAAEGVEVGWLTQRHSGSPRLEVIDRIRVHRVGNRATQYPLAAVVYLWRLRRRYDVVVDCENGVPFFSPLYCRLPKILVVHHVHQEIFRAQLPRQIRWFALWLEGWLMPRAYRNAEVVAVSEGTRSDLIGLGFDPARIRVVTNGVVPPKVVSTTHAARPTIMCMGRLAPQKSVDVLIRALPAIIERFGDVHVDIVGQGPDRARLERLAWTMDLAKHVRFHGYVASSVRDQLASDAWLSVCTSSFEGWGVVCMEASSRGLPVVASNVAGLREAVRDGETGLLFPFGDHLALADSVIDLLGDPERREQMGAAGRKWAAAHTWDRSAAVFSAIIESMTGRLPQRFEPTAPVGRATGADPAAQFAEVGSQHATWA